MNVHYRKRNFWVLKVAYIWVEVSKQGIFGHAILFLPPTFPASFSGNCRLGLKRSKFFESFGVLSTTTGSLELGMALWAVVYVLMCVVGLGGADRPELVGSSVWYTNNASLLNVNFDAAVVQLDFDQPLYTNGHSYLCPESDVGCPPLTCQPCDWSVQEPTGCDNPNCCGPAQHGDMEAAEAWCSNGRESYTTLRVGEISERFTLAQGERMYVRFFLPEEYYCRPFHVISRPYYGSVSSFFSTFTAYPDFSTARGWRKGPNERSFGFGLSSHLICPNTTLHPQYTPGTFAGMIYGVVATSFEIEISVSPQVYPLPPPPLRIPCGDLPEEVMNYASTYEPAFCVEDGRSRTFVLEDTNPMNQKVSMVLPIPKGCHTLSLSIASEIPNTLNVGERFFCLPSSTNSPRDIRNANFFRLPSGAETMVLSACFEEEVTYLFCSLRFIRRKSIHFSFSTIAPVLRKPMTNLPDASLAYMDAYQHIAGISFGLPKYPCIDFYVGCFDWVLTPSDDTLFFFPPPTSPQIETEQVFEDIQEFYRDSGLQEKKENRLSLIILFEAGNQKPVIKNLTSMSVIILSVTNEEGETVKLPGGGIDVNPESQKQYSISNYIPHIPLLEIPELEFPPCDTKKYNIYEGIVADRVEEVGAENSLEEILSLKYSLDVMNEALLAKSCTTQVANNLDTYVIDVVLTGRTDCLYEFGTVQYWSDPCCNAALSLLTCCLPYDFNSTETPYGTDADVSDCGEPECAESYYEDLSFSLNHLEDVSVGCNSGIKSPSASLATRLAEVLQDQYTSCLEDVGFGGLYKGVDCQIDSDCDQFLGICHEGKCALPFLEELEDQFLDCYINKMPSSFESFLKRNILPPTVANSPKSSPEFYNALKAAASLDDCVNPEQPLEIGFRTRYLWRPLDYACLTQEVLGLVWPDDFEQAVKQCPGEPCLRSYGCLNTSSCLFTTCRRVTNDYIVATEETCPPSEDCSIDVGGDCEGSYCVYCPANGDLPCTPVPGITSEEECSEAIACELPDGTIDFTLTEEECRNQGEGCSTDCLGDSCESVYSFAGGCFVPSLLTSSDCSLFSSENDIPTEWYKDELCVLSTVLSEVGCGEYPSTEWETCQQNELDVCTGSTLQQQYLGCYVSKWHECPNEEECEASGQCTDRNYFASVTSFDPVEVQYGKCAHSGEYVSETAPNCGNVVLYSESEIGCLSKFVDNPVQCSQTTLSIFSIPKWVEPALTKEECLSIEIGRSGCRVYRDALDVLLWILDEDECRCQGGFLSNAWEWIPGVWGGGTPRQLQWRRAERKRTYKFKQALSFILLAEWIRESSEEQFLYSFQSQIICESQSITNSLFALVCDCLADGGEVCYTEGEQQKEIQMGLSEVCEGETNFVKDPSAQVNFGEQSVSSLCSFLNISLIHRNWFSAPSVPPPLSFKWQDERKQGVVLNKNGATVGEVLGDGLVLSFSSPSVIQTFDVCLRLSVEPESYKVADFGYSTEELKSIYPLGMNEVDIEERDSEGVWYCSPYDFKNLPGKDDGVIRIFPINRLEDYEEEENNYTDSTTRALCYTLGALFCFMGVFSLITLLIHIYLSIIRSSFRLNLHNFGPTVFIILCIFRASFMFLYPTGTFEDEPLAYFVVFEIPTFLLFSVLVYMIYSFKRLVFKKGFFPGNPTPILAIGWSFVWGLWVIVTIVYAEVILDDASESSACEGRVQNTYNAEDETRQLAIAYQSVIIAITFVLTAIFFYYTSRMYKRTKERTPEAKRFVILVGGAFNISFFARTVLFLIILIGDFASSIYLFCTLFFTEVVMMVFLLIEFNIHHAHVASSAGSDTSSRSSRSTRESASRHGH